MLVYRIQLVYHPHIYHQVQHQVFSLYQTPYPQRLIYLSKMRKIVIVIVRVSASHHYPRADRPFTHETQQIVTHRTGVAMTAVAAVVLQGQRRITTTEKYWVSRNAIWVTPNPTYRESNPQVRTRVVLVAETRVIREATPVQPITIHRKKRKKTPIKRRVIMRRAMESWL